MKKLVVLYGQGGLSDVGRHAVQVALEKCSSVTVLTQHPESLDEPNWNCGCPEPHAFTEEQKSKLTMVPVEKWNDETLYNHFEHADAVVSCIGNRQPTFMDVPKSSWCAHEGNQMVIKAMKKHKMKRVIVLSSFGVEDDWPPGEFHWAGKIMRVFFLTCARKPYNDLTNMERAYRKSGLDYLLVRPVGIGEDQVPQNEWHIQTEKYKDTDLEVDMAKLDVARYMVQEALEPTRHEDALVIGGVNRPHKE